MAASQNAIVAPWDSA